MDILQRVSNGARLASPARDQPNRFRGLRHACHSLLFLSVAPAGSRRGAGALRGDAPQKGVTGPEGSSSGGRLSPQESLFRAITRGRRDQRRSQPPLPLPGDTHSWECCGNRCSGGSPDTKTSVTPSGFDTIRRCDGSSLRSHQTGGKRTVASIAIMKCSAGVLAVETERLVRYHGANATIQGDGAPLSHGA
jgi:hypothetical protein